MKYDDASWHYEGDFPAGSPEEYGGTHIALFLKWCFKNGWTGELHLTDSPDDTQALMDETMSATEFFFKNCDGKLTDEDFNAAGNEFAQRYYGPEGLYLNDYANEFADLMYVAGEEMHDYERFSALIERRIKSGVLTETDLKALKPFWKFW